MTSQPIESYAIIGDTCTAGLVGRDGSIDWLCLPRFDSPACFAALLGTPENGRWQICPAETTRKVERRYRDGTLVLETTFTTDDGRVTLIDLMPLGTPDNPSDLVRIVRGDTGSVRMHVEIIFRFDYGSIIPWVTAQEGGLRAIAGPEAVFLRTPVALHGRDMKTYADLVVNAGETVPFVLRWNQSHLGMPAGPDADEALAETERWWRDWSNTCASEVDPWREAVIRSLITLKALTYSPTGGIVAAATTSLPERLGGERNWDYRFCWVRDATFTLYALLASGYRAEAKAWRDWLHRAVAGEPSRLQILYSLTGERRLAEQELPWLRGYADSSPVRVGNAAHTQCQLDTYGELMDVLHVARRDGIEVDEDAWQLQRQVTDFLESAWNQPDSSLWEMRGPRRHFTHSKMMAWVAVDRAIKAVERFGLAGPVEHWRSLRDRIHADVCHHGFNAKRNAFVQSYGSNALDASLLMMPLVGFLPATDPRVASTVDAIQRELMVDGLVFRYQSETNVDGLPPGEGAFLACSFWLADCLALSGRRDQAVEIFEELLALRNDVGLLAEEYDPHFRRQLGNFPQAFSHVGLVNTAHNLAAGRRRLSERPKPV